MSRRSFAGALGFRTKKNRRTGLSQVYPVRRPGKSFRQVFSEKAREKYPAVRGKVPPATEREKLLKRISDHVLKIRALKKRQKEIEFEIGLGRAFGEARRAEQVAKILHDLKIEQEALAQEEAKLRSDLVQVGEMTPREKMISLTAKLRSRRKELEAEHSIPGARGK